MRLARLAPVVGARQKSSDAQDAADFTRELRIASFGEAVRMSLSFVEEPASVGGVEPDGYRTIQTGMVRFDPGRGGF